MEGYDYYLECVDDPETAIPVDHPDATAVLDNGEKAMKKARELAKMFPQAYTTIQVEFRECK